MLTMIAWLPPRILVGLLLFDLADVAFQITPPAITAYFWLTTAVAFLVFLAEVCIGMMLMIFIPPRVLARWEADSQSNP